MDEEPNRFEIGDIETQTLEIPVFRGRQVMQMNWEQGVGSVEMETVEETLSDAVVEAVEWLKTLDQEQRDMLDERGWPNVLYDIDASGKTICINFYITTEGVTLYKLRNTPIDFEEYNPDEHGS